MSDSGSSIWSRLRNLIFPGHAAARRAAFLRAHPLPSRLGEAVAARYPHLDAQQVGKVLSGLRDFYAICQQAGQRTVSMPSQVVDVAWHEMILSTSAYADFCAHAFGRFLHHVPAEAGKTDAAAYAGIRRAWRLSCRRESIDPLAPARLPLLFALDTELAIPDGFHYVLNCDGQPGRYCASHLAERGCSGCASRCEATGCDTSD